MNFQHFVFTSKYWDFYKLSILSWKFVFEICKWFGGFWLIIEPASFFSDSISTFIKPYGIEIFFASVGLAIFQSRPRLKYKYFITDKDVYVNVVIGDLLRQKKKDIVVPTNVHFITELSNDVISEKSIQGQFTNKHYSKVSHLDSDILNNLGDIQFSELAAPHFNKSRVYALGTTAKLAIKKKQKKLFNAYLFAMATINEHKVCQSNITEFQTALPSLWSYIQQKGELADIAMPILGSGFCRIDASREDLFKEILFSFLAAIRNSKFCKSLTIVIYYKDIAEMNIDLDAIKDFTRFYTCNFTRESIGSNSQSQPVI